jgi:hypothetical protein
MDKRPECSRNNRKADAEYWKAVASSLVMEPIKEAES